MTPPKILVVDDEDSVLKSTRMLLSTMGYESVTLSDPRRVLEVAVQEHPDLILQDMKMPQLNLPEMLRQIRSHPQTAQIPLLLFSASPELPEQAAQVDAAGYLTKPFLSKELSNLIERTLHPHDAVGVNPVRLDLKEVWQRELERVFHDYWNLLTAVNGYVMTLEHVPQLPKPAQEAVEALNGVLPMLQAKADELQSKVRAILS